MKKIINRVIFAGLVLLVSIFVKDASVEARTLGIGSEYRYNAPTYYLGDEIYCEIPNGWRYYKMVLNSYTNINVYGRGYEPDFQLECKILDSNGTNVKWFLSEDKTDWGYEQINDTVSLSPGTYYIGIYTYWSSNSKYSSHFGSWKLTEIPGKTASEDQGSNNSNKSSKILFASKTSVTVEKGKRKKITVTLTKDGYVNKYQKSQEVAVANWSNKWNGNKISLYIYGVKKGKAKIVLSNSYNNEKITINVKVKDKVKVRLSKKKVKLKCYKYTVVKVLNTKKKVKWKIISGKNKIDYLKDWDGKNTNYQAIMIWGEKRGKVKIRAEVEGKKMLLTIVIK